MIIKQQLKASSTATILQVGSMSASAVAFDELMTQASACCMHTQRDHMHECV
jgi:hypothetical protein